MAAHSAANQWKSRERTEQAQKAVDELSKAFRTKNPDIAKCKQLLSKAKIAILDLQLTPPFTGEEKERNHQLSLGRETMEIGVLLSVISKDLPSFERYMSQLKVYYFDYKFLKQSEDQLSILGLNLTYWLSRRKLSEFHTELELLPLSLQEDKHISFPIKVEQDLMEGNYRKVIASLKHAPNQYFHVLLDSLVSTVRDDIAACAEKAYEAMSIQDALTIFMIKDEAELAKYANLRNWTVNNKLIQFPRKIANTKELPSQRVINDCLLVASELERIV